MATHSFYYLYLVIHLSGFALFTGTFVADTLMYSQLWRYCESDISNAKVLFLTTQKYARLMGIALGLVLLAGILMMSKMHVVYGAQLWMRVKILFVIILIVIRILNTRNIKRLKIMLGENTQTLFVAFKKRITFFQLIQLIMIGCIIVLSVFKFN